MNEEATLAGNGQSDRDLARARIMRVRRTLIVALVVLVVLLLVVFGFLVRIYQPMGQVANEKEARGVEWVRSIYGWGNTRSEQLGTPQSVAFGPDGTIWVTDAGMARVLAFNPDGTYRTQLSKGARGTSSEALSYPSSVAVDQEGLVYIGDMTASEIVVMSPDNEVVRRIPVPRPQSVAVTGDMLVVGSSPGFAIMSIEGEDPNVLGTLGSGDDQFDGVSGVAIDANYVVYVADQYNNRVSAYDRTGKRLWVQRTGNSGNSISPTETMVSQVTTAAAAMQLPSGITIDSAGRLVLVDAFGFQLVVLDSKTGDFIARYGDAGVEDGKFVYPSAIAYDPERDYFAIADTSMGRVQIVRIPDSGDSTLARAKRTLLGPARACLVPLALLFLVLAGGLIYSRVKARRSGSAPEAPRDDVVDADVTAVP